MFTFQRLKIYLQIFYNSFLEILAYPYELVITVVQPAIQIGLLSLFWTIIARSSDSPVNVLNMVAYFVMVEFVSIWSLSPDGLNFASYLGYRIKKGNISNNLIRPISVLPSLLSAQRGSYFIDMIFSIVLFGLALRLVGNPNINQLLWFFVFMVLSFIITFSICVLVGSVAFVTKEINSIRHSVSHIIRLLSGGLVPLTFISDKYRTVLEYTPFPSMVFAPINVLQNNLSQDKIIFNFYIASTWSIILFMLSILVWRYNMKKYEAVGI